MPADIMVLINRIPRSDNDYCRLSAIFGYESLLDIGSFLVDAGYSWLAAKLRIVPKTATDVAPFLFSHILLIQIILNIM